MVCGIIKKIDGVKRRIKRIECIKKRGREYEKL